MSDLSPPASRARHQADERTIALFRTRAYSHGYAIAVHGSRGPKDLDLVAIPWMPNASSVDALITDLASPEYPIAIRPRDQVEKPHGRRAYILIRLADHRHIDLSVMPPVPKAST